MSLRDLLLTRRGVAAVVANGGSGDDDLVRAVELELAKIGYVISTRLRLRLTGCTADQLAKFRTWALDTLLAHIGGDQKHEPLFRRFPEGVPDDTEELWWKKVLVHFLQADDQPCLFCRSQEMTHVLNPCRHVVCSHCFDGSNYSGCPVCEERVDRSSPFFLPSEAVGSSKEHAVFKLIDLVENSEDEARLLFVRLCHRTQALSPDDKQALIIILREFKAEVLAWLPEKIPVRENVAIVFGTLFQELDANVVLPVAKRYMTVATDVLRFIAVLSGTDGSLLPETIFKQVQRDAPTRQFWDRIAKLIGAYPSASMPGTVQLPIQVHRFKVARLSRSLRRALLEILEGLAADRLIEDMLRHRSYWVWIGEFLHPHEYATRFPNVARAFQIVRTKSKEGTPAPEFRTWYSRVEKAFSNGEVAAILSILTERPGEFARRVDLVLRASGNNSADIDLIVETFKKHASALSTPILLTLKSYLSTRLKPAKVRVFWPKGRIAMGATSTDNRQVLSERAVTPLVEAVTAELLRRFSEKPHFHDALIDDQLRTVTVPFNERTASVSAVSMPRGSRIPVPLEKKVRLFLHWCEPPGNGNTTDLDLSVALYDSAWQFRGVCSYYELKLKNSTQQVVAQSAGDLRNAPWPMGASEFVDLDCNRATEMGARFAVMVINAYAGLSFSQLERGFAGLMLRDSFEGRHFDPLTVKLKFALDGANGVFMPFALDLQEGILHWLDVQAKGYLEMNNVENCKSAVAKLCPDLISYFESGIRASMYDLALLHAAARCERAIVRGARIELFERQPNESRVGFFHRLTRGKPDDRALNAIPTDGPALYLLYNGDVELPDGSTSYALFRERTTPTIAASDLIS